jgi:hypothetical protein
MKAESCLLFLYGNNTRQKRDNRSSQFCKKRTTERRSKCYKALFCKKAAMCSNFQRNFLCPLSLTCVPSFKGNLLSPLPLTCVPVLRGTCCLRYHTCPNFQRNLLSSLSLSRVPSFRGSCCLHDHLRVFQGPGEPVVTIITCPNFHRNELSSSSSFTCGPCFVKRGQISVAQSGS